MPVLHGCGDDETGAYLVDDKNQFLAEDGNWHQIVGENSFIPLQLREENLQDDDVSLGNQISKLSYQEAKREQFEQANKSEVWNKLMWLFTIVFGTLAAITAITKWG